MRTSAAVLLALISLSTWGQEPPDYDAVLCGGRFVTFVPLAGLELAGRAVTVNTGDILRLIFPDLTGGTGARVIIRSLSGADFDSVLVTGAAYSAILDCLD